MAGFGGGTLDATVATLTVTTLTDGTATLTGGSLTGLTTLTMSDFTCSNVYATSSIRLNQYGAFLKGIDGYGNTINLFKVDYSGKLEPYTTFKLGSLYHEADSGDVTVCNMPVTSSSPYGTSMSLNFMIDDIKLLELLGTADGAGTIINPQVVLKNLFVTDNVYSQTVVAADTTFTNVVKAKHLLVGFLFFNTTANASILDCGIVATGNSVFTGKSIAASGWTFVRIDKFYSLTANTTLYLNDDTGGSSWNSGSYTVYIITQKLVR